MTSYAGRHAELYDLFYSSKPYEEEAAFVDWCIRQYSLRPSHHLLEIACGTGRHAVELDKRGYSVLATDYSADILNVAHQRAHNLRSMIEFDQQDMRALELGERQFDAAVCLFDAIGYVQTNEAVVATLRGLHRYLQPDGLFIVEFWHAAAMLSSFEPLRVREWKLEDRRVLRIASTELRPDHQLACVTYKVFEIANDGTCSTFDETQCNRYFLLQEMRYLLTTCGFELLDAFDGFSERRTITRDTWHVVAVARKTTVPAGS